MGVGTYFLGVVGDRPVGPGHHRYPRKLTGDARDLLARTSTLCHRHLDRCFSHGRFPNIRLHHTSSSSRPASRHHWRRSLLSDYRNIRLDVDIHLRIHFHPDNHIDREVDGCTISNLVSTSLLSKAHLNRSHCHLDRSLYHQHWKSLRPLRNRRQTVRTLLACGLSPFPWCLFIHA